jgi:hypothetical protein
MADITLPATTPNCSALKAPKLMLQTTAAADSGSANSGQQPASQTYKPTEAHSSQQIAPCSV